MPTKAPWIGTSWKMNKTRLEARAFAEVLAASGVATTSEVRPFVIPPFTAIADVVSILSGTKVKVGAQNMHWADSGPWTGEISPLMLKDVGAVMVEIGHSERRAYFGETDDTVALKTEAAVRHGLLALVCIGDTLEEYRAGATAAVLAKQVHAALSRVPDGGFDRVVLAYEPVWSIGEGGTPAEPGFANEQHAPIKEQTRRQTGIALDVVYGGSVNPGNCRELARHARYRWPVHRPLGLAGGGLYRHRRERRAAPCLARATSGASDVRLSDRLFGRRDWRSAAHGVNVSALKVLGAGYPFGTLAVNVVGSFVMGFVVEWFALRASPGEAWRLFLTTGILGGFTTFSAFSFDTAVLIERGAPAVAAGYVLLSVVASIAALFLGLLVVRQLV